jgi:hypothetical protein
MLGVLVLWRYFRVRNKYRCWTVLNFKAKGLRSFETSGGAHRKTFNICEELNPQE